MNKYLIVLTTVLLCLFKTSILLAQEPYKLPPKNVIDILNAPPPPRVLMSPARDLILLADYEPMPSIAYLSQPVQRLAGIRIMPCNNSRQVISFHISLSLKRISDGSLKKINLPQDIRLGFPSWSANGQWIVFLRYTDNGVQLWSVEAATGNAKAVTPPTVNTVLGSGFTWMPDHKHILVSMIPEGRGKAPEAPRVPQGPNILETQGNFSKTATYQDLLKTPYDEDLFEYYATSQLVVINLSTNEKRNFGKPGLFADTVFSPASQYIFVNRLKRPFSYSLPYYDFARAYEVWNSQGELVKVIADLPPAENVPLNGVPTGPRNPKWQPFKPATIVWLEALDGGDPEKDVPFRDKMLSLPAPFSGKAREIARTAHRLEMIEWLGRPSLAFLTESDWKKRWRTTWLIDTEHAGAAPKKIFDLSEQDQYTDPGYLVTTVTKSGEMIGLQHGDWIYLSGLGSSPQGDRPFLDQFNIKSLAKKRLFRSSAATYERFIDYAGNSRNRIIISAESKSEPPNLYLLDLEAKKRTALTDFKDPAPQLTGMKKEIIKYKRDDGIELSGTLYLPPGYKQGQKLPVVIWAYPMEYSDAGTAGQVRGSANRFTFFRGMSQLFFVTQGYAVLDNATMPVIGDPKTMNDTFVQQIVASAKAAIDTLDTMGVGDRNRVGIGGHSYGAFMTANLLAHCDLFAAGIARSGAYNRTLTPFGFQSERRTLWEAPETYIKVSPFMHADKIKKPILLIHGEADNNSGTFPIQSERLFAALKGLGGTARLVMLPYESHGYSARESVLDVLAEMFAWFDKYVKNKN